MNIVKCIPAVPFTLASSSASIILATHEVDFSDIPGDDILLEASVEARYTVPPDALFPVFGVFVLEEVPLAGQLWTDFEPDVEISADGVGAAFQAFEGSNTIPNPGAPRVIVFAVRGENTQSGDDYGEFEAHAFALDIPDGEEDDSGIDVEIVAPPGGTEDPNAARTEVVDPDEALAFTVTHDGLPSVLTADVTLSDGTVERAWDFDQAVNGYIGTLSVIGTTRLYTIRRPIGWPFGRVTLTVHAEA